ncbi:MAG: hypothetical protein ACLUEK_06165 [Oscillospiraceae bacterium]
MEAARLLERRSVLSGARPRPGRGGGAASSRRELPLWRGGTMYGDPEKQSVGGAVVSFMLRPCAFAGLVVFGRRQGARPGICLPSSGWAGGLRPRRTLAPGCA